jgi:hypothetical protein
MFAGVLTQLLVQHVAPRDLQLLCPATISCSSLPAATFPLQS